MYTAADLRKGLKIDIDGQPYIVSEFNFVKPGKGQALYVCKLKNMITGATLSKTYRSNDKFQEAQLEEKKLLYSYQNGDDYVFVDQHYEQFTVPSAVLGDARRLLTEDMEVEVLFHKGRPVHAELPTFVEKRVEHTEPGARGDTVSNVMKPATVEGGFEIKVPLFVNEGDVVRIDTRTGEYVDRVRRK